jgi:amino acid transporter
VVSFGPSRLAFVSRISLLIRCYENSYLFKYLVITPNQLTAAALVIQYWIPREKLNPGVFVAIFLVAIFCINYFGGIRFFGEFEFWLSSFKVIVIVGIILFSLIIACGGGPTKDPIGFRHWKDPGAFAELKPYATGSLGRFLGFWSVMVNATFAYLGTELVGVTAGEAQNPRRTIPKAIRLTFYRILFFYCLSVLLVGMIVPYNSDKLQFANASAKNGATASASPFVVAADIAMVKGLPHIINACILVFVFSASNSDLYIASRTLYGLASDDSAPAIFKRTDSRGVPYPALIFATAFACLAFMNVSDDSKKVFGYFVNLTTVFGILAWISILVTHLHFVKARNAQNLPNSAIPFAAPQGYWGSMIALFFCCLICLTKNFTVFVHNGSTKFEYKEFITGYIGIPVYFALLFGHMLVTKSRGIAPHEVDFYTGKSLIDREEQEYLENLKLDRAQSRGARKFYHKYVAWLF